MKKYFLFILPLVIFTTASKAQTRVGALVGYASNFNQPAIGGNIEQFLHDKISVTGSMLTYFPETHSNKRWSYFEMNLNGNYYLYNYDVFEFYALAGINYSHINFRDKTIYDNSYKDDTFNLNLGGGVNFKVLRGLLPFSEVRVVLGGVNQLVVVAGVRFTILE